MHAWISGGASCDATFHWDTGQPGAGGAAARDRLVGCCQGCEQGSFLSFNTTLLEELLAEVRTFSGLPVEETAQPKSPA